MKKLTNSIGLSDFITIIFLALLILLTIMIIRKIIKTNKLKNEQIRLLKEQNKLLKNNKG